MAKQEAMYWPVPITRKLTPGDRVPSVIIETLSTNLVISARALSILKHVSSL